MSICNEMFIWTDFESDYEERHVVLNWLCASCFRPFWIDLLPLLNCTFDPVELTFWPFWIALLTSALELLQTELSLFDSYAVWSFNRLSINQSLYQSINPNQSIESLIDIKVNLSYLKECAEFPLYVRMFKLLSGFVVDCENYTKDDGSFCPVEGMPLLFDRYEYVEVIGQGQSSILLKAKASNPQELCTCSLTDSLFVIIWQQFLYLTKKYNNFQCFMTISLYFECTCFRTKCKTSENSSKILSYVTHAGVPLLLRSVPHLFFKTTPCM